MKKTIITVVLALCVISTVCCAYAAAVETAKTEVVLTVEETTVQSTAQFTTAQIPQATENQSIAVNNDSSTVKTGSIVSYTTIATVFLMLTATVVFFWFYKRKKLTVKE